jgi:hypothetical protein
VRHQAAQLISEVSSKFLQGLLQMLHAPHLRSSSIRRGTIAASVRARINMVGATLSILRAVSLWCQVAYGMAVNFTLNDGVVQTPA